jgi:hypothetical protein
LRSNERAHDAEREMFVALSRLSDSRRAVDSSGVLCELYEGLLRQANFDRTFPPVNP